MANDPPFATLNHVTGDLGIPSELALLRIGIKLCPTRSSGYALARPARREYRDLVHRRLQRPCAGSAVFPTAEPDVFNTDQGRSSPARGPHRRASQQRHYNQHGRRKALGETRVVERCGVGPDRSRSPPPWPARSAPRRPSASDRELSAPPPVRSSPVLPVVSSPQRVIGVACAGRAVRCHLISWSGARPVRRPVQSAKPTDLYSARFLSRVTRNFHPEWGHLAPST